MRYKNWLSRSSLGMFTLLIIGCASIVSSQWDTRYGKPLTIAKGIIGAYPNAFMQVREADLPDFAECIKSLKSEDDYKALRDRYGIRRTNPDFWKFSDELLKEYRNSEATEAGLLDYNRLENR